jgi:GNAT superfamily N-acetyltransferase
MARTITAERTWLEMRDLSQLRSFKLEDDPLLRFARVPVPSVTLIQRLYRDVGERFHWVDRWKWSEQGWREWVERPGYGVWVLSHDGELAGFVEMRWDDAGECEIELFGLLPSFQGRGLGKHLLSCAAELAFAIGTSRLWLHTCTLDGPHALPNYLARGFQPFRTETYQAELE